MIPLIITVSNCTNTHTTTTVPLSLQQTSTVCHTLSSVDVCCRLQRQWDSRQKLAVNVTDKLTTLLLMLILSTVFTCVFYIKHLTTSLCQNKTQSYFDIMKLSDIQCKKDFQNVQNNLKDTMTSMKPTCIERRVGGTTSVDVDDDS